MIEHWKLVTNVEDDRVAGGWIVRGQRLDGGQSIRLHTRSRDVMASCLGAKILRWSVRLDVDESGQIQSISVME